MNDIGYLNLDWAQHLSAALAACRVRHAVISPGARSTPLTLALLRHPDITTQIAIDERAAAFMALGMAKAAQAPVVLVATSGTAPAHWLPAVMEASHSAIALLLLSADRPPELHGCGANQTTDQTRLFGTHIRNQYLLSPPQATCLPELTAQITNAVRDSLFPLPGPVHINVPFREPLLPKIAAPAMPMLQDVPPPRPSGFAEKEEALAALLALAGEAPGWIVCGELAPNPALPAAVSALAQALGCPVLAEPLSQLRFAPELPVGLCTHQEAWTKDTHAPQPAWVLRFGGYPVTRSVQQSLLGARHVAVDPYARRIDPDQRASHIFQADAAAFCQSIAEKLACLGYTPPAAQLAMRENALQHEQAWSQRRQRLARSPGLHEAAIFQTLLSRLEPGCPLFIGNSLSIRDLDAFSGSGTSPHAIYCNRGLSGIDGNVSTAAGIAKVHGQAVAIMGDLTFQHDIGGLALAAACNVVYIVLNNGGGGIFETLDTARLPEFETGWLTAQTVDLCAAARSFSISARSCTDLATLADALEAAFATGGAHLIELKLDRQASLRQRKHYWQLPA